MSWNTDRFLEFHRKIRKLRSKLCKEIFGHIMAVIVFSGLVIISLVDVLKYKDPDLRKLTAAVLGICHFGLCATAILHLKYCGVMELNPLKCKIWIYLEVYNIAATTAFIVLATRHLLPAPFHQWTGTAFLLIIYWLPLIMYKTSQVCRMLELVNILIFLRDASIESIPGHCCEKTDAGTQAVNLHQLSNPNNPSTASTNLGFPTGSRNFSQVFAATKPLSASSPQIPYEWALIESMSSALP